MKHLQRLSVAKRLTIEPSSRCGSETDPGLADAKSDFMNAIYRAWTDYVYQKKNELSL
ncbi:MAG: hypothetical protein GWP08_04870 [Nitrospiraceae bacterium]|nr:hypothetical protein [Nitrospiraceae bacterium]